MIPSLSPSEPFVCLCFVPTTQMALKVRERITCMLRWGFLQNSVLWTPSSLSAMQVSVKAEPFETCGDASCTQFSHNPCRLFSLINWGLEYYPITAMQWIARCETSCPFSEISLTDLMSPYIPICVFFPALPEMLTTEPRKVKSLTEFGHLLKFVSISWSSPNALSSWLVSGCQDF